MVQLYIYVWSDQAGTTLFSAHTAPRDHRLSKLSSWSINMYEYMRQLIWNCWARVWIICGSLGYAPPVAWYLLMGGSAKQWSLHVLVVHGLMASAQPMRLLRLWAGQNYIRTDHSMTIFTKQLAPRHTKTWGSVRLSYLVARCHIRGGSRNTGLLTKTMQFQTHWLDWILTLVMVWTHFWDMHVAWSARIS